MMIRSLAVAGMAAAGVAACSGGSEEAYDTANRCVAGAEEMIARIGQPGAPPGMEERLAFFEEIAEAYRERQRDAAGSLGISEADIETHRAGYRETIDDPNGFPTDALADDIAAECAV